MKFVLPALAAGLAAALLTGPAAAAPPVVSPDEADAKPTKNIVETAQAAGSFKTLLAAAKAAGLAETLSDKDATYTVFAPTDEAFEKLPEGTVETLLKPENKEKLKAVLLYHVVKGEVKATDVLKLDGKKAKTVGGKEVAVMVKDGKVKLNEKTTVVKTDIMTTNGVIHVIDSVLLPPEK